MRRLPRIDRVLLWVLTPLWLAAVALHLDRQLGDPPLCWLPLYVEPASGPAGYPTVTGWWPETPIEHQTLAPGDRVLSIGGRDVRGAGHFGVWARALADPGDELAVPVAAERSGARFEAALHLRPMPVAWRTVPLSLALGLSGLLALHRGRGAREVRFFALGALTYSLQWSFGFGGAPWRSYAGLALFFAAGAFYQPFALQAALLFPPDVAVRRRAAHALCWVFAVTAFGLWAWLFGAPIAGSTGLALLSFSYVVWIAIFLGILARNYRRTDGRGRRQLMWVLLGFYVGLGPALAGSVVFGLRPDLRMVYELSLLPTILIPLCLYIAFLRYQLYDIGRLVTTTVAITILAPIFLGILLTVAPVLAEQMSALLGLHRTTSLWVVAFAIAAPGLALVRWLQPRIERVLFRERFQLERGLRELRTELRAIDDPQELFRQLGARLAGLLALESLAIYARGGEFFAPVFAAGPIVPPGFASSGALCALLSDTRTPVDKERLQRWLRSGTLPAVESAALASLGVEAIVPLPRGETLDAFVCLGDKRSGDIFTRPELALLEALAEAVALRLERHDEAQLLEAQRALYESLASFAPEVVREEIERGADFAPGEREVSVLFVDIRGYTAFAAGRGAAEIFRVVNAYTSGVSRVIREHGGSVVEFHGDGLMAAFGAPRELPGKERAAVEAARAVVKVVDGGLLGDLGDVTLSVGVGIATGASYVGTIQTIDRRIWSVIGNTSNLASRLEALTRTIDASIAVDATTHERAGSSASDFEAHLGVRVKGRDDALAVYALPRGAAG